MNAGIEFVLVYGSLLLALCWLLRKRVRRNRRTGLPVPNPACVPGHGWRAYARDARSSRG